MQSVESEYLTQFDQTKDEKKEAIRKEIDELVRNKVVSQTDSSKTAICKNKTLSTNNINIREAPTFGESPLDDGYLRMTIPRHQMSRTARIFRDGQQVMSSYHNPEIRNQRWIVQLRPLNSYKSSLDGSDQSTDPFHQNSHRRKAQWTFPSMELAIKMCRQQGWGIEVTTRDGVKYLNKDQNANFTQLGPEQEPDQLSDWEELHEELEKEFN